jgi:hypothetical protein
MRALNRQWLALAASILISTSAVAAMTGAGGDTRTNANRLTLQTKVDALPAREGRLEAAAELKSLSDGLLMSGEFTYAFQGSAVTITLERIDNSSFTRTSGTLRLALWATTYKPNRGDSLAGYELVTFSTIGQLQPRTYFSDIVRSAGYLRPPNGAYWLNLVLEEYNPSACPANSDGYCLTDTFISFSQVSWGTAQPSFNYSDLWWTATESGWGISLLQHPSNIIFAAWFTYDNSGLPKWYVASDCQLVGDFCYGTLYETTGSPFSLPFNPAAVTIRPVGTLSLQFTSYGTGVMSYSVRGVTATKQITRQPF